METFLKKGIDVGVSEGDDKFELNNKYLEFTSMKDTYTSRKEWNSFFLFHFKDSYHNNYVNDAL